MAAGDTFRAAASDQLEIWAERTGCEIVVAEGEKAKAATGKTNVLVWLANFSLRAHKLKTHYHNIFFLTSSLKGCEKREGGRL